MFLQTLNIEWGQIDPKDNRKVNCECKSMFNTSKNPCPFLKVHPKNTYSISNGLQGKQKFKYICLMHTQ